MTYFCKNEKPLFSKFEGYFAAIDACKQQLSGTTTEYNLNVQSECSEQTSSEAPVLEEFIPIKRASSHSDGEELQEYSKKPKNDVNKNFCDKICKKSDWLRSVQLWNQTPDPLPKEKKEVIAIPQFYFSFS